MCRTLVFLFVATFGPVAGAQIDVYLLRPGAVVDGFLLAGEAADFNGDGREDLFDIGALVADGTGAFQRVQQNTTNFGVDVQRLAFADVDGDGDVDVMAGGLLWKNNGFATFSAAYGALPLVPLSSGQIGQPLRPLLRDFDGDGDIDCLAATDLAKTQPGPLVFLANDGAGNFSRVTSREPALSVIATFSAAGDFDGDGDFDVVIADESTRTILWNMGAAGFVPAPLGTGGAKDGVLADFDGDGAEDLLFRGDGFLELMTATPQGFGPASIIPATGVGHLHALDLDLDGDSELVTFDADGLQVWSVLSPAALAPRSPRLAFQNLAYQWRNEYYEDVSVDLDIDLDGDHDLVFLAKDRITRVFLSDGQGGLDEVRRGGLNGVLPLAGGVGDFDSDGDLDVLGRLPAGNGVYEVFSVLNDGYGVFERGPSPGSSVAGLGRIACTFDADGDSDLDLFVAGGPGEAVSDQLLLNVGGRWTPSSVFPGVGDVTRVVAADVDGDGDEDVLLARGSWTDNRFGAYADMIVENLGGGIFAAPVPIGTHVDSTQDLDVGDVDGDGDLDLLVTRDSNADALLCLNDGSGNFTVFAPLWGGFGAAVLADLDGDGDLEAVVGDKIWRNDGGGQFTPIADLAESNSYATPMVADDVDGDGDQDLVNFYGYTYYNQGGFVFTEWLSFAWFATPVPPVVDDLDADGDRDIVLGGEPVFNHQRAVHHRGLPIVGTPFTIVARTWESAYWLVASAGAADVPYLLGSLLIEPTDVVIISSGMKSTHPWEPFTVPVYLPDEPAIAGRQLHLQCVSSDGLDFHFSNRHTVTILP